MFQQLRSFECRGRRILIALFNGEFSLCINLSSFLNAPEHSANVATSGFWQLWHYFEEYHACYKMSVECMCVCFILFSENGDRIL